MDNAYKLVAKTNDQGAILSAELYDLQTDPTEKQDLAPVEPAKVRIMVRDLEAWRSSCRKSLVLSRQGR